MTNDVTERVRILRNIVEDLAAHEPYFSVHGEACCALCDAIVSEGAPDEYSQHHEHCPYRRANEFMESLV